MTKLTAAQTYTLNSVKNLIRPSASNKTWALRHALRMWRKGAVVTSRYTIAAQ